jgi:hypothetical protein
MFYTQNKLIESIQQDRQREATAERLYASRVSPEGIAAAVSWCR